MPIAEHTTTIESCRFCFMCRHVCTVGVLSGRESDTPRGKGLILFTILKGHAEYGPDLVETLYRGCLCGLCETWCKADYPAMGLDLEGMEILHAAQYIDRLTEHETLVPRNRANDPGGARSGRRRGRRSYRCPVRSDELSSHRGRRPDLRLSPNVVRQRWQDERPKVNRWESSFA